MTRPARRAASIVMLAIAGLVAGCLGPVERPVANFVWCPDGSSGRLDYWFLSTSQPPAGRSIESLRWEFGDGSTPVDAFWDTWHRFSEEAVYRVTLTVTDSWGISGTVTKDVPVAAAAFIHSTWQLTLGWPVRITGVVENRWGERLENVVIKAKFYDADGIRLTDGTVEVTDLDPGEKAAFSVTADEYSARIFHATVEVDSFFADCSRGGIAVPVEDDAADR